MADLLHPTAQQPTAAPQRTEDFFPLEYSALRQLAQARLARERPDHILSATCLVHETFLRLSNVKGKPQQWNSRCHFLSAAAEAMRRILIESARKKRISIQLGDALSLDGLWAPPTQHEDDLFELDELLQQFAIEEPQIAELVKLRLFAGLSMEKAAAVLGMPRSTAYDSWSYACAWFCLRTAEHAN